VNPDNKESTPKPVDKTSEKEKHSVEVEEDLRNDWAEQDRDLQNRKPDLEEIEEDPSGVE
jgi:hypothetical protein